LLHIIIINKSCVTGMCHHRHPLVEKRVHAKTRGKESEVGTVCFFISPVFLVDN
jgi:hypothetical protein